MHNSLDNLIEIQREIQLKIVKISSKDKLPKIIAVTKTHPMTVILPLIKYGHNNFGENKIQEAIEKWSIVREEYKSINLHFIGRLQSNKVKLAVSFFDYIHSLDSKKLAIKISEEQVKQNKKVKIFIQINIGNEEQKSGIKLKEIFDFCTFCKNLDLNIIGTMCVPPKNEISKNYFLEMNKINQDLKLPDLSMGMSEDYLEAAEYKATFLRIGSKIFGQRN